MHCGQRIGEKLSNMNSICTALIKSRKQSEAVSASEKVRALPQTRGPTPLGQLSFKDQMPCQPSLQIIPSLPTEALPKILQIEL